MTEADHQENLAGHLEIDALPRAGRTYEPPEQGIAKSKFRTKNLVGNPETGPNMFAVGEDRNIKKKKTDDDDKDDGQSDGTKRVGRPSDLDSASPAKPKAASNSATTADGTQPIKQVSQTDATAATPGATNSGAANSTATKTGAVKPAVAETDDDDSKSADPPASRWSFWQLFKFGGSDVSGNKEP